MKNFIAKRDSSPIFQMGDESRHKASTIGIATTGSSPTPIFSPRHHPPRVMAWGLCHARGVVLRLCASPALRAPILSSSHRPPPTVPTVNEGYFAGALHLDQIPSWLDRLWLRFNVWSGVWSEGDHRNWQAIRTWAEALVVPLQL